MKDKMPDCNPFGKKCEEFCVPSLAETDTSDFAKGDLAGKSFTAAFSRNASQLAIADSQGNITVCDYESVLAQFSLPLRTAYNLTWSSDSTLIAANTNDRVVMLPLDKSTLPREFHHGFHPVPDRARE